MVHLLKNMALKVQHYEPVFGFFFFALPCFVGIGNGMINTSFIPEKPHCWNLKLTIFIYTHVWLLHLPRKLLHWINFFMLILCIKFTYSMASRLYVLFVWWRTISLSIIVKLLQLIETYYFDPLYYLCFWTRLLIRWIQGFW